MQIKQQSQKPEFCDGCKVEERWFLHNVRHRGTYRRFCTNCLLKNHQGLFCPYCFIVYDEPLRPHVRLTCFKCPSISHLSCTNPISPSSPSSFLCPSCFSQSFSFFKPPVDAVEKGPALALVAAAKIAAASMSRAAALARVEAERRVKEASFAKKKAREALERVGYLVAKEEEMKRKEEMEEDGIGNGQVEDLKACANGGGNGVMNGVHPR